MGLRDLRLYRDGHKPLTLAALAERCDPPSSKQYLGKVEGGRLAATPQLLKRIAHALRAPYRDVQAAYLEQVGGVDGWIKLRKRTARYWAKYHQQTEDRKRRAAIKRRRARAQKTVARTKRPR